MLYRDSFCRILRTGKHHAILLLNTKTIKFINKSQIVTANIVGYMCVFLSQVYYKGILHFSTLVLISFFY